jgi:4'-phosphopantetheinyl transferase
MNPLPRLWTPASPPPPRDWLDSASTAPLVWLARLPPPETDLAPFSALLSAAELARAATYRLPADRARSIVGRALLRSLLAAHLGREPASLELSLSPAGKPFLARPPASLPAPEFNLSHSGELVLAAFHPSRAVGVDVEQIRADQDWTAVSERLFPPPVHTAWLATPPSARAAAFFRNWTRHEAALKATSTGFFSPDAPASAAPELTDLTLPPGYAGACAWLPR